MSERTPTQTPVSEPASPMTARPPRRFRVSVRVLMGIVLVLAVAMGYYVTSVHTQQAAVAAIRATGGTVDYNMRWGNYNPDIEDNDGKWRVPKWLARIVPVDYGATVTFVSLMPRRFNDPGRANDDTMKAVGQLPHVEVLRLINAAVTDAGMAELEKLTKLRHLDITQSDIGDAGLRHLKGLKGLRSLWLDRTRVTDDGVLELERALPGLNINRSEELISGNQLDRAKKDLEFARTQPVRLAATLLAERARWMIGGCDEKEVIATVEALCALDANDPLSLIRLAENRSALKGSLEYPQKPCLSATERTRLQTLCTDAGIHALAKAITLGYDNIHRLDDGPHNAGILRNLRRHPRYQKLIDMMRERQAER